MGRIDPYARSSCASRFQWKSPATAKVSVTHSQTYEHELFGVRKADFVYKLDHIDLLCKNTSVAWIEHRSGQCVNSRNIVVTRPSSDSQVRVVCSLLIDLKQSMWSA